MGRVWAGICMMVFSVLTGPAWPEETGNAIYPAVRPGLPLRFPDDFGAHPDYRTEWWYVTGWLKDGRGVERGFQVTFFRVRTGIGEDNPSRFAPRQLILAHAAVADAAHGRLRHAERAARAMDPFAGARAGTTDVWIRDWALKLEDGTYRTRIAGEDFSFELDFRPNGAPVLNGDGGFSRKARDPRHASHYYSRPQMAVSGTLILEGETLAVSGNAWLDHEWSSGYLPPEAVGWDWLGINLVGGGSLMAFQMRDANGQSLWRAGTLRNGSDGPRALLSDEISFTAQRRWRSPRTGAEYPVVWLIDVLGRELRIEPLMDDQELDGRLSTGAIYWEGAVRVLEGEVEIGRGYLEMTGYAERLRM